MSPRRHREDVAVPSRRRLPAETPQGLREAFTEQSRRPFETSLAECLREGFVKPSRCLHEAFTQWARRGASAKGSRRLHERFMKTSRALKASRSLREGFAKASRRLQPYPRRLREGFAKAPRAPPFGNDSSDNDKPPIIDIVGLLKVPAHRQTKPEMSGGYKVSPLVANQLWRVNQHEHACIGLSYPWSFQSRSGILYCMPSSSTDFLCSDLFRHETFRPLFRRLAPSTIFPDPPRTPRPPTSSPTITHFGILVSSLRATNPATRIRICAQSPRLLPVFMKVSR